MKSSERVKKFREIKEKHGMKRHEIYLRKGEIQKVRAYVEQLRLAGTEK